MTNDMAFNPYSRTCPSRRLLNEIGETWTVLIIGALSDGPMRFTEIVQRIDGVSQKMVTQTLRTLERDGLVTRTQYNEIPPRVVYELTDSGRDLAEPLRAIELWATTHMGQILEAREAYDQAKADAASSS